MKKLSTVALGIVLAAAACGESPTEAPLDLEPAFTTVPAQIGDKATWYYEGVVSFSASGTPAVGEVVTGSVSFEITGPATPWTSGSGTSHDASTAVSFTVSGAEASAISGPNGGVASGDQSNFYRAVGVRVSSGSTADGQFSLTVADPAATSDFSLVPPALGDHAAFLWIYPEPGRFLLDLTKLYSGPQTKDDCKKGGYEQYGFKNQGQCVRYVETGKDSR